MALALLSVTAQMVALAAATGWAPGTTAVRPTMASAVIRSLQCAGSPATRPQGCPAVAQAPVLAGNDTHEHIVVPSGASQCPNSGAGAACSSGAVVAVFDPGSSAVPEGLPTCPQDPAKAMANVPGSCSTPSATAPASPAAPAATAPSAIGPAAAAPVVPDAGAGSPQPKAPEPVRSLTLTASSATVAGGAAIRLDARSSVDVSGTPFAIEIFDTTTHSLVAACTETTECQVSFSAKSGLHSFVSYVVSPTQTIPTAGIQLTSNKVGVRFVGITLAATAPAVVGPGKSVTFVATTTEDVGKLGLHIEIHDATNGAKLTYCSRGTTCSMGLVEPAGGVHTLVATLQPQGQDGQGEPLAPVGQSAPAAATWLAVKVSAASTSPSQSAVIQLSATANADLSTTPYSIYFFDASGKQIGDPCHAISCAASTQTQAGAPESYIAVIARMVSAAGVSGPLAGVLHRIPTTLNRLDIQAGSAPAKPVRMLWGVDSCKRMTDDPAGTTGLLPKVSSILGAPDFWGRYLPNTANCPGLNSNEIAAAHNHHIGILPIYNDYDCSAVSGNAAGSSYGLAALTWLQNDLVPLGTAVVIDIEPPGDACPGAANVDAAFIAGWYDRLSQAGYAPAFYGNTTAGSAFGNAWCTAVRQRPEIAEHSYLWSFEPSLGGSFSKGTAPAFGAYNPGCAGHYAGWQYLLSAGATPDVDQDEAVNILPIWYP